MAFPVTDDKIAAAETVLGRRFPVELRARLKRMNGGEIATDEDDWFLFPVHDDSDRKRLSRTANDIVLETGNARKWRNFPADAVAVASNGSCDLLVLAPDSDEFRIWDHETGELLPAVVDWR